MTKSNRSSKKAYRNRYALFHLQFSKHLLAAEVAAIFIVFIVLRIKIRKVELSIQNHIFLLNGLYFPNYTRFSSEVE